MIKLSKAALGHAPYRSLTDFAPLIRLIWAGGKHRPAIMSRVTPLEQLSVSDVVANPVLAEVIRSGFVESRHRGSIVFSERAD